MHVKFNEVHWMHFRNSFPTHNGSKNYYCVLQHSQIFSTGHESNSNEENICVCTYNVWQMFYCWDYRLHCYYVIPLLCEVYASKCLRQFPNVFRMNTNAWWDQVFISIFKFIPLIFWKYFEYEIVLNLLMN